MKKFKWHFSIFVLCGFFALQFPIWTVQKISNTNFEQNKSISEENVDLFRDSKTLAPSQFLNFPIVNQNEHSMADALPKYVDQKIATAVIEEAIANGLNIDIVGCPPSLLSQTSPGNFEEINVRYEKKISKKENYIRPSYYYKSNNSDKSLVISVMSGEDYLKQYTAMVSYFVKFGLEKEPDDHIRVTFYPTLQDNMTFWTGLDSKFVKPNDTVLMGNISNFFDYLQKEGLIVEKIEEVENPYYWASENPYYWASRIRLGDRTLSFLRVKHSFWGNMSSLLVSRILDLGASEIIYLSKVATLKEPENIYKKIYSPTQLAILEEKQIKIIERLPNYLVKKFPELDSGMHISLATVMEQDFDTSVLVHSMAATLDLEVSKIAKAILEYNQLHKKEVKFTPVHWSTDYLRTKSEANFDTGFDLANGDSKAALENKKELLNRIYNFVIAYLAGANLVVDLTIGHASR
jgi:hypothetical protein